MTYFLISFLALIISLKAFAQNLTFEEYWIQVKNNNPLLKESESKIKVIENSPSILIPAPEISVSQMNEKVPFSSSGKMQRTFEISQSIPYFSKFSKASELRDSNFQKSISERSLLEKKLKQEAFEVFLSYTKNIELKKNSFK